MHLTIGQSVYLFIIQWESHSLEMDCYCLEKILLCVCRQYILLMTFGYTTLQRDSAIIMKESQPAMASVVQNHAPLFPILFLSLCLCSNLKYSRSSGCATWTQATCQGLSTCLAMSAPCEGNKLFGSYGCESLDFSLSFSHISSSCVSDCHFAQLWPVVICQVLRQKRCNTDHRCLSHMVYTYLHSNAWVSSVMQTNVFDPAQLTLDKGIV